MHTHIYWINNNHKKILQKDLLIYFHLQNYIGLNKKNNFFFTYILTCEVFYNKSYDANLYSKFAERLKQLYLAFNFLEKSYMML